MLKEATGIKRVVLKMGRTDLRRGIDGLKAIIILNGMDPLEAGTLYLFCGTRNDRIRGLLYEGLSAGFCYPHILKRIKKIVACSHQNLRITFFILTHKDGQVLLHYRAIQVSHYRKQ